MGTVSDKVSPEFVSAVKPLPLNLLQQWEIVILRELIGRSSETVSAMDLGDTADSLTIRSFEGGDSGRWRFLIQR
jgi:hypothetical protein